MKHHLPPALACLLAAATALPAWAGRPLSTDDAATADAGTCQIESWAEHSRDQRSLTAAGACGVSAGMEFGLDATAYRPSDASPATAGASFKWAPAAWSSPTPLGNLAFGLKLSAGYHHPAGEGWQASGTSLLGLASWNFTPQWALHMNLGAARDRASATTVRRTHFALTWSPLEPLLLYTEAQTSNRPDITGNTQRSFGARWWLTKDRLGLDVTTTHSQGTARSWGLGLGWYGLGL